MYVPSWPHRPIFTLLTVLGITVFLSSCNILELNEGHAQINLAKPQSKNFDAVTLWKITGSGPRGTSLAHDLGNGNNQATFTRLPTGSWTFNITGFNDTGRLLFRGSQTATLARGTNNLSIAVQAIITVDPVVTITELPEVGIVQSAVYGEYWMATATAGFASYTWFIDGIEVNGDPFLDQDPNPAVLKLPYGDIFDLGGQASSIHGQIAPRGFFGLLHRRLVLMIEDNGELYSLGLDISNGSAGGE